jgi:hypothetical protein
VKGRILRFAVTILLLAFVVSRVDLRELAAMARAVDPRLVALGYALHVVMIVLNAWRWQLLVRAQGALLGLARLTSYYFVCMFFNTFTPTSVGGDVARVIDLSRHTGRRSTALASVLVERIAGLFVLLPVSLVGLALSYRALSGGRGLFVYLEGLLVLVLATATALLASTRREGALRRLPLAGRLLERPTVANRIASVHAALDVYRGRRGVLAAVIGISAASRALWIVSCYVFGRALRIDAPLSAYLLVIPLVEVARMVPISLSGLGIREGAVVVLFAFFGVASSAALGLSILVYAPFLLNGLAGGVIYATRGGGSAAGAPANDA